MKDSKPIPAVIRNYTEADFENLIAIQAKCFPPPFPPDLWWNEAQLNNHVAIFPEGALCIEVDGILAGSLTGVRVNFNSDYPAHTWEEMTDNGYIGTHNSTGNTLYIVDIAVRPDYRKLGIGKILMQAMYHVVVELGIDRLLGGGRMPGYHKVSHEKTPEQYVDSVVKGELKDPVLTFLLSCGRKPLAIAANYLDDAESNNFGVLMEWRNPFKMK
ncbi:GNAT family N-acetyltransferase [Cytobacillus horneckiae]|uniref:GNAT family N-acetyltransferase n=1 Tax=Cytobacillus horneckiae TaxID=549687 RepID=UPI002041DBA0|nr:GNAT family N-acetyltransferase [Cytobacillus horneckiae]MCM3177367.1 GNAT family N-acetyltransferase [Cytobacillus horneckiae]